jgi:succinate dehydrogenase / fumarate reductase, iron-sulfur subunit
MNIDGANGLAGLTPMDTLGKGTSQITPLPHLQVLRDLIPDLTGLLGVCSLTSASCCC